MANENDLINRLRTDITDVNTVLDVGSGTGKFSMMFPLATRVDAWEKANAHIHLDLETNPLPFPDDSFDYILMLDFIEHLSKNAGVALLEQAKRIVKRRIYLLTPLWWTSNVNNTKDIKCWAFGNQYDLHKSLWKRSDFDGWVEIGFTTIDGEYFWGYWEKNGTIR